MSDKQAAAFQTLPPHVQLIQMAAASWVSATVYAAAKLGLADHLASGARSAEELALARPERLLGKEVLLVRRLHLAINEQDRESGEDFMRLASVRPQNP